MTQVGSPAVRLRLARCTAWVKRWSEAMDLLAAVTLHIHNLVVDNNELSTTSYKPYYLTRHPFHEIFITSQKFIIKSK